MYRALNLSNGRIVAVKRIKLEDRSEEEIKQLSNEVDLLKSLDWHCGSMFVFVGGQALAASTTPVTAELPYRAAIFRIR